MSRSRLQALSRHKAESSSNAPTTKNLTLTALVSYLHQDDNQRREKTVEKDIAIIGEPTTNPATCKFTLDRPVYPGGSAYFGNRSATSTSPAGREVI